MKEQEIQHKRTTYFWKGFCYRCFRTIEYPLLGDFSYGEHIYQTIDGQDFFIATLLDNEVVEQMKEVLKGKEYKYGDILTQLADKPNGIPLTSKPRCPKCRRKLWITPVDNVKTSERDLGFVTWTEFLTKHKDEREDLIKTAYKKSV